MSDLDLADQLSRALGAGRAAWPTVDLPAEAFIEHVARHVTRDDTSTLDELAGADLYLAAALACQLPAAVAAFEAQLGPEIDAALQRLRLPGTLASEAPQRIRVHLLVADGRELPRIADYAGRGSLATWVRVSATRIALNMVRAGRRELLLEDVIAGETRSEQRDPEVALLKETYGRELKAAITAALAELPTRSRNLLRHHILDGLTIDELAVLFGAHRASCARWLAEARATLASATRKQMMRRLQAPREDVESILRFLESDIELSIDKLLAVPAAGSPG